MIRKSNAKNLITESKYSIKIEDYSASRFPFCIYEEDEYLVSFPTKREAQQKLFLLNELYQEAIGYSVKSREGVKSPSRVDFEEDDYIEEDEEVDLELTDDEEVPAEEAPAEEAPVEEPAEEEPAEVDEDPDSEAAALEKEALKDAINLAEGFFHAAKVSEDGAVKKVFPEFINENLKADAEGAKAMKEWADGVSADPTKKATLGLALGLSVEDGVVGGKGLNTWLKEVSEKSEAILEVLMLKIDEYLALKPEGETEEAPADGEAPAEGGEGEEELPEDDLFGGDAEEPETEAPEEPAAEETEDLFA